MRVLRSDPQGAGMTYLPGYEVIRHCVHSHMADSAVPESMHTTVSNPKTLTHGFELPLRDVRAHKRSARSRLKDTPGLAASKVLTKDLDRF